MILHGRAYVEAISRMLPYLFGLPTLPPPASPPFAFPNIADWLFTCVKLHLYFYCMMLKIAGFTWLMWTAVTTKTVLPKWKGSWNTTFQDSFDKDNPVPLYHRPRKRSIPSSSKFNHGLMAALALLQASPSSSAVFQLRSEANQLKAFKKHRDAQGMLSTASMPVQDLYALQQCLQLMSSELDAHTSGDSFVAVVDTGCSITCTNVETDFIPGTMQDLPSPIKLDGIAGGLVVTKQGQVCWEALDDFGNVVPFQTQAFYQEKLPCRLLSPQAFLKHSSQRIEDHFKSGEAAMSVAESSSVSETFEPTYRRSFQDFPQSC